MLAHGYELSGPTHQLYEWTHASGGFSFGAAAPKLNPPLASRSVDMVAGGRDSRSLGKTFGMVPPYGHGWPKKGIACAHAFSNPRSPRNNVGSETGGVFPSICFFVGRLLQLCFKGAGVNDRPLSLQPPPLHKPIPFFGHGGWTKLHNTHACVYSSVDTAAHLHLGVCSLPI